MIKIAEYDHNTKSLTRRTYTLYSRNLIAGTKKGNALFQIGIKKESCTPTRLLN